jgi:hypothetical protein
MNNGDSPVLSVYLPEDLSVESVHAISDFLSTISQYFDQMYAKELRQAPYTQETESVISDAKSETTKIRFSHLSQAA